MVSVHIFYSCHRIDQRRVVLMHRVGVHHHAGRLRLNSIVVGLEPVWDLDPVG